MAVICGWDLFGKKDMDVTDSMEKTLALTACVGYGVGNETSPTAWSLDI